MTLVLSSLVLSSLVLSSLVLSSLASAMRFLDSCVAPVRGGTYFSLPPQRKVGKRKRANTVSPSSYPRAPNVPGLHLAACQPVCVANVTANASPAPCTRTTANHAGRVSSPCGKRCVGCRAAHASARTGKPIAVRWFPVRCGGRPTVCRMGAQEDAMPLTRTRVYEAGEATFQGAGNAP